MIEIEEGEKTKEERTGKDNNPDYKELNLQIKEKGWFLKKIGTNKEMKRIIMRIIKSEKWENNGGREREREREAGRKLLLSLKKRRENKKVIRMERERRVDW